MKVYIVKYFNVNSPECPECDIHKVYLDKRLAERYAGDNPFMDVEEWEVEV